MWGDTLRIATEAKVMAEQAGALTKQHIDDCNRRADRLAADLARRDEVARADSAEWRAGVGQRFDRQDHMNWVAVGLLVTVLISVVGTSVGLLVHTYGFMK